MFLDISWPHGVPLMCSSVYFSVLISPPLHNFSGHFYVFTFPEQFPWGLFDQITYKSIQMSLLHAYKTLSCD